LPVDRRLFPLYHLKSNSDSCQLFPDSFLQFIHINIALEPEWFIRHFFDQLLLFLFIFFHFRRTRLFVLFFSLQLFSIIFWKAHPKFPKLLTLGVLHTLHFWNFLHALVIKFIMLHFQVSLESWLQLVIIQSKRASFPYLHTSHFVVLFLLESSAKIEQQLIFWLIFSGHLLILSVNSC